MAENDRKSETSGEPKTPPSPGLAPEAEAAPSAKISDTSVSLEELTTKLGEAEKKAAETYNRLLYLQAEFENFKKRMEKEKIDLLKYGHEKTIVDFLPVVDHLLLAKDNIKQAKDSEAILQGIEMTLKSLLTTFDAAGCKFFDSLGVPFDPNLHDAVMNKESADVAPDTVIQEFQKGCTLNGRLLRPAKVVVSKMTEKKS